MLNTILFDLDGTLAPFMQDEFIRVYFQALTDRLTPMGYDGRQLVDALWKGVSAMVSNKGGVTNRQIFWECFTQRLGIQALALESILDGFYSQEFDGVRSVLKEQVDRGPLIHSLREKGYTLVLATNPIFPLSAVSTRLGWVGLAAADFDYVTTYEDCRHSKPNPAYYRSIMEHIGKRGDECLMVGNNPVDDMAAAQVGMAVYLVTDYMENPGELSVEEYPHSTFQKLENSLSQLPAIA